MENILHTIGITLLGILTYIFIQTSLYYLGKLATYILDIKIKYTDWYYVYGLGTLIISFLIYCFLHGFYQLGELVIKLI